MGTQRTRRVRGTAVGVGAAVLGLAVLALFALLLGRGPDRDARVCNGVVGLCELRLDQVALAGTHNSSNSIQDGASHPSQDSGISTQLKAGVRALLIDAYLKPGPDGSDEVYLCHESCELGAVPFSDVVEVLRSFLATHPHDVLVVVIQDELPAERLLPVLEDGGLTPYLATLDPTQPLPTLGAMVDSGQRLVLGLEHGDLGPQIPNVYADGLVQEVPYDYRSLAELESARSCRPSRGHDDAPLFLLNNWISPPSRESATEANSELVLSARVQLCSQERQRPVNLIAVDFYEDGDLLDVVDQLNQAPNSK